MVKTTRIVYMTHTCTLKVAEEELDTNSHVVRIQTGLQGMLACFLAVSSCDGSFYHFLLSMAYSAACPALFCGHSALHYNWCGVPARTVIVIRTVLLIFPFQLDVALLLYRSKRQKSRFHLYCRVHCSLSLQNCDWFL